MVLKWEFLGQRLQLNYLTDLMTAADHQSMVKVCWVRAVASNDCAGAAVSGPDDGAKVQFQDVLNDALVTDDSTADVDCREAKAQAVMFCAVRHGDSLIISKWHKEHFRDPAQKHFHPMTASLLSLRLTLETFSNP